MADFHEKNRKWFTSDAFLVDAQGVLTHGEYVAGVAREAESLMAQGAGPGEIVALGVKGGVCSLLYGLADAQGYRTTLVGSQVESGQWRSLLAAVRPALVAVARELQDEAQGVLRELPGRYRAVLDGHDLFARAGVVLYAATERETGAGPVPGAPHMFVEREGAGVRVVALTADVLMDAVRAVCAELALNHHDRCLWALPTGSLLGRLAVACVFFRGAAGTEGVGAGAEQTERPTAVFTDGSAAEWKGAGLTPGGPDEPKMFRLVAGVEAVRGAPVPAGFSSATLAAVGSPLPTFRLHSLAAVKSETPAGAVLAAPILGVQAMVVDESGTETPAGGTGRLLVRSLFAPTVAVAADAGAALANLAHVSADSGFALTGYLARQAQPGRMWLWPDPEHGNAERVGGRL